MYIAELFQRLGQHAREMPDRVAYCAAGNLHGVEAISWRQLNQAIGYYAVQYASTLKPGQTILISSPNRVEMIIAMLAALAAGLRAFPISCDAAEQELTRLASESSAVAAVGSSKLLAALNGKVAPVWNFNAMPVDVEPRRFPERPTGDLILQSSGTTGFPRLVLRNAASIDAVCRAMAHAIDFDRSDRVLALLPLSHSYGIEHGLLAPIWAGSTVVLGHGLDITTLTHELNAGVTILPTVPSVIEFLADMPGELTALPHIRRIYSAGATLPAGVYQRFLKRYHHRVSQLYGTTEIGSVTFNSPDADSFQPASVGLPMKGVAVRIAGLSDPNQILSAGTEGQINIKADSMFSKYLDGSSDLNDGYFPTGDLGSVDANGRLFVTGRIKLLINVGGLKVNPLEVEAVLREHPAVGNCVVVPIRQSETVFRLKAILAPRDPAFPPPIEELRGLARLKLAAYKVPRMFEIRPSLPTTPTGKVLRHLVGDI